jgi:hypothetical protein
MFKKQMLFLETPPMSADWDNPWIFRELGFDVDYRQILNNLNLVKEELEIDFANFDVVVLCMEASAPPFSHQVIQEFRQELLTAMKKKDSHVFLIGISVNINEKDVPKQNEIYENLFLPGLPLKFDFKKRGLRYAFKNLVVSREKMQKILKTVLSRELVSEEEQILKDIFPKEKEIVS